MLEHTILFLQPWSRASGAAPWQRRVTDSAAKPLGFVRSVAPVRGSWFSWLRRTRLEVYETEDASHLMTLVRAWSLGATWITYDADALFVGTVHPRSLIASDGVCLGERLGNSASGQIVAPDGVEWLTYQQHADTTVELRFAKPAMANPFLRMVLLGSVLMLDVPSAD
jgi:hypothetical protein